jgi:hypothetical protein
VSGLENTDVVSMNLKHSKLKIPSVTTRASIAELGQGDRFPYKAQLNPIMTFQGMVFQSLMCNYFHTSRFIVFSSSDYYGDKVSIETAANTYCVLEKRSVHLIHSEGTEIDDELKEAQAVGANIFFILFPTHYAHVAAKILERGTSMGLFGLNKQIYFNEEIAQQDLIAAFTPGADVAQILNGAIKIRYDPNYNMMNTDAGLAFVDRWRKQQPTLQVTDAGNTLCSNDRDDEDMHYLYRSMGLSKLQNFTCAGLDFSKFASDGSDIAASVPQSYDSVFLLAHTWGAAMANAGVGNEASISPDDFMDTLFYDTMFTGISGVIDPFEGNEFRLK